MMIKLAVWFSLSYGLLADLTTVRDETTSPSPSTLPGNVSKTKNNCTVYQFQCNNYRCIRREWLCDGDNDCKDMSDENRTYCETRPNCSNSEFRCTDDRCVSMEKFCNGIDDCGDMSEENVTFCQTKCKEFFCNNNKCIEKKFLCDGQNNCGDGSDEINCTTTVRMKTSSVMPSVSTPYEVAYPRCRGPYLKCANGKCIPEWQACDNYDHCGDFSDEYIQLCRHRCRDFSCRNYRCINKYYVCDGKNDCGDGSDEENCTDSTRNYVTLPSPSTYATNASCRGPYLVCTSGKCVPEWHACDGDNDCGDWSDEYIQLCRHRCRHFSCRNYKCIHKNLVCNGQDDCRDGSDEENCLMEDVTSSSITVTPVTYTSTVTKEIESYSTPNSNTIKPNCAVNEFTCNNKKCISKAWICDGEDDCRDMSDENSTYCRQVTPCKEYEFQCNNGTCLPINRLCNGRHDCGDLRDERDIFCRARCFQFSCRNNRCIEKKLVCNQQDDCGDSSDEMNCIVTTKASEGSTPNSIKAPTGKKYSAWSHFRLIYMDFYKALTQSP